MAKITPSTPAARELAAATMREHGEQLHRFLRRRVRHADDLDDLAQEVYLRLLRVKDVGTVRDSLAYVYGVAAHVVSEFHMRGHKSRVVFDSEVADITMDVRSAAPERLNEDMGGYFQKRVNDALGQISDMRLAVLLLERRDGLSHADIAARLGLSVHTVKKYAVQALAQVRASLE